MSEQVSDCHGVDVEMDEDTVPDSGFRLVQQIYYYCSICHKPCIPVAREKEDDKS